MTCYKCGGPMGLEYAEDDDNYGPCELCQQEDDEDEPDDDLNYVDENRGKEGFD